MQKKKEEDVCKETAKTEIYNRTRNDAIQMMAYTKKIIMVIVDRNSNNECYYYIQKDRKK